MPESQIPWPHAPTHQLSESGTYFVTAATYHKAHHFRGADRLGVLQRGLLKLSGELGWPLEAWAIFSNHYHFVGHSPIGFATAESLSGMLGSLHAKTAGWINRLDGTPGRQVWHNYWETRLTYPRSYLARLNYVHQNPCKHGLVHVANQYPWCSAGWFERTSSPAMVNSIYHFNTDSIRVSDEFEPAQDW
jgi:putative transposase